MSFSRFELRVGAGVERISLKGKQPILVQDFNKLAMYQKSLL
jgi:hypothetical protein